MQDPIDWSDDCALIVDDSRTTRAVLKQLLVPTKIEVHEAIDATTCVGRVGERKYQVVLLDLALPDGNGLDLLRQIRAEQNQSTILMITGSSDIRTATDALRSGADGYVEKRHLLEDADGFLQVLVSAREHRSERSFEESQKAVLTTQSVTDALTGAFNRRYLESRLKQEIALANLQSLKLCLLILDVDHFKAINDKYGHTGGDQVLQQLSELLRKTVRESDPVVRYGGEEFVVLLPKTSHLGASILAEKIRQSVERHVFGDAQIRIQATISVGLAELKQDEDGDQFIARADEALYKAKASGRNRLVKAD